MQLRVRRRIKDVAQELGGIPNVPADTMSPSALTSQPLMIYDGDAAPEQTLYRATESQAEQFPSSPPLYGDTRPK